MDPTFGTQFNGLEAVLRDFETADNQTIQVALEAIHSSLASLETPAISISGVGSSNPLIEDLFSRIVIFKEPKALSKIYERGYESAEELVKAKLERILWNRIDAISSLFIAEDPVKA